MKMKLLVAIAAFSMVALATPAQAQRAGDKIANSYICVFDGARVSRLSAVAEAQSSMRGAPGQMRQVYDSTLRGFAVEATPQAIERIKRGNRNIAYCEEDQVVTAIQSKPGVASTAPSKQVVPWGIARVNGGRAGTFATAWVIDTGIQLNHPDLNVDVARSRNFTASGDAGDQNGHGTHVAGTIAARNNTIGVIGVAPGAKLVSVRVLDRRGMGSSAGLIAAIDYVAKNGRPGDVATMSLGGGASPALDNAVINAAAKGIRFVIAAGNESRFAGNVSPARANGPNVFTISAFAQGDNRSTFSNFGNPPIDFAAPGSDIQSTWIGSGYKIISGTSMAVPHFAGILLQGAPGNGGRVNRDPDGNPDVIGVVR